MAKADTVQRADTDLIRKPLRIVLVEDCYDDEDLSLKSLAKCGIPLYVRVAHDGYEGMKTLGLEGSEGPRSFDVPDLVISDLKMPKMSGAELLKEFRAEPTYKHIPFVIFSSSEEPRDIKECLELGATAYALKPMDFSSYGACVSDIVRHCLAEGARPKCVRGAYA